MPFGIHRHKDKEKERENAPIPPPPASSVGGGNTPPSAGTYAFEQPPRHSFQDTPISPGTALSPTYLNHPDFKILRSTTNTQEEIFPPDATSQQLKYEKHIAEKAVKKDRRLSERLHIRRSVSSSHSSVSDKVPEDIVQVSDEGAAAVAAKENEDRWEWRASQLAMANTPSAGPANVGRPMMPKRSVSDQGTDADIQEAIRLHEAGDLEASTKLFKRLADPAGANNPLSQVLYGLALRHGWGVEPNSTEAIKYLQAAAVNSADIEQQALRAGMRRGGSAKGELVLAIFELGNCFRQGWGTEKDPVAAFNYYQTAANLGDTDAMNETAWCYLNGYGVKKKDKYQAAKYYRMAEANGNKTMGNSWIYKEKYDNPPQPKSPKSPR